MGGGAFWQVDIVQTLDQCLHRFQLPEQERQLVPFRQRADQQLVDAAFLLGAEAAALTLLAPTFAHRHGAPATGLPRLVGRDDGRR
ncbi:hypothetical protein D3C76_1497560 [compost metagenome]